MREMIRSALIAKPPSLLYHLVDDVASYPLFVPGCASAEVLSRSEDEVVARLTVRRGPLHTQFTTRNTLDAGRGIRMDLVDGPFRVLEGLWSFTPVGENGCRIELRLKFQFSNRLKGALFEPLFEDTVSALVRAFVTRAQQLEPQGAA